VEVGEPARLGAGPRSRIRWFPVTVFLLATVAFLFFPLLGMRTFASVDKVEEGAPYRTAIGRPPKVESPIQTDQTEGLSEPTSFYRELRKGHFQRFTPRVGMGVPSGILPFNGLLSPFSVAYLLTPAWYAAGLKVALTLLFCMAGTYLLLRRLGGGVVLSTLGGLAYAFCGVNVVLLHRMSAQLVLPALLLAVLLLVERPNATRAVAVAVLVAWSWYEGFPSLFAYCLYTAVGWGVWLIVRRMGGEAATWRERVRVGLRPVIVLGTAVAGGVALAGVTLVPFVAEITNSQVLGQRTYDSSAHLPAKQFFGIFDLTAIGTYPKGSYWTGGNPVESATNMGLIVTAALVAALLLGAFGRVRLTARGRDAWTFFTVLGVVATVLVFLGTPLLTIAYHLPGIAESPIQRIRFLIVLSGVVVAVLGLSRVPGGVPGSRVVSKAALAFGVLTCAVLAPRYIDAARAAGQARAVAHGFLVQGGLAAAAVVIAFVVIRRPALLVVGGLVIAALMYGQLAWPLREFTPASPVSDFYTRRPGHEAMARLLDGRYRFISTGFSNFYLNSSQAVDLYDARNGAGALKTDEQTQLMATALPGAFAADPFKTVLHRDALDIRSPVLDDMAVRYVAIGTNELPFGNVVLRDPDPITWLPSPQLAATPLSASGPVQGLVLHLRSSGSCDRGSVEVRLQRPDGSVATSTRPLYDVNGTWLPFAIDGQSLHAGDPYRVEVRPTSAACRVEAGTTGDPAPRLARWEFAPDPSDPVRLASTEQSWIYERPGAWPVVSGHTRWRAFGNQADALAFAGSRSPSEREVVAYVGAGPDQGNGGAPPSISGFKWGDERITFRTDGAERSLMVVSQNGGDGWQASVDGKKTSTVAVDGALVGIFVPPGRHDVQLEYRPWHVPAGLALSGAAALVAIGALVVDRRRRRARA